jgi:hypothetical protein
MPNIYFCFKDLTISFIRFLCFLPLFFDKYYNRDYCPDYS